MSISGFSPLEPKYKVKTGTLKETCEEPQVWEAECLDGLILYIRFSKGILTCKEKWNGALVCSGSPSLDRTKVPTDKIPFYLEMYSNHTISFI